MIRLFTGYDPREEIGWHVFVKSVLERASVPVQIIPLGSGVTERDGTNAFTYIRWLVPYYCEFKGIAIFMDGVDMLMRVDIAQLEQLAWQLAADKAVSVVKHDYRTRHRRKYIGTELEADNFHYPRKNWSSLALWNCSHPSARLLTPDYIRGHGGDHLHRFAWCPDDQIGALDPEWNVLVGEQENAHAKVAHFTLGLPGFKHYKGCDYADEWRSTMRRVTRGLQTHVLEER